MSNLLFKTVADVISKASGLQTEILIGKMEFPPSADMGDVAFPCFFLAKELKKSPMLIAQDFKAKIDDLKSEYIDEVFVIGGYLNFKMNKSSILKEFFEICAQNKLWLENDYKGKTALIEHTSINPNASPHIGRARNALIGDATSRLLKFLGYDTTVHYFVNDIGKQIALLVYYTENMQDISFNDLLTLYVKANEELKTSPEIEEKVFELLHQMETGNSEVFKKFSRIVDICLKGQMNIFNEIGIFYDKYDYESQYIKSGRTEEILNKLKETEFLFKDDVGRLVLNLEKYNINSENPYLPLTRKDLTSLYPLRDICYSIDKSKVNADKNIVVLGEDQKLYGREINAVLDILGYKGADIINYSFVLLADGKMSTREGKVVLLEDLMRETVETASQKIMERKNISDIKLSKQLAYGAIKYSILKCSNDRNVIFDKEQALSFDGDTSIYLQYSRARIMSILQGESITCNKDEFAKLDSVYEWDIVQKLLKFNSVLKVVENTYNFSVLCNYLYELCKMFSRWYNECPIKNAEPHIKNARLYLAKVIAETIKNGLYILGIEAPDRI